MLKRVDGEQRLDHIAEKVVAQAMDGDDKAYREVGDRLDGKATQHNEHSGAGGGPIVIRWKSDDE